MTDNLREELVQSSVIFQGRIISVSVDTVRLPDGMETTREVVKHHGAVAMVPILPDNCVVLVRQWRHAAGRALLEIPAGSLNPGEDPLACAERELMEEIGYRTQRCTLLSEFFLAPGYSSEKMYLFLAEELIPDHLPHDEDERIEVVTLSWDEIADYLQRNEFGDAKTIAGLLLAREYLARRAGGR